MMILSILKIIYLLQVIRAKAGIIFNVSVCLCGSADQTCLVVEPW